MIKFEKIMIIYSKPNFGTYIYIYIYTNFILGFLIILLIFVYMIIIIKNRVYELAHEFLYD